MFIRESESAGVVVGEEAGEEEEEEATDESAPLRSPTYRLSAVGSDISSPGATLTPGAYLAAPAPSLMTSPRSSLARNSLTVPVPLDGPGAGAAAGGGGGLAPPSPHLLQARRCSARLLSLNVREALRQLRQREHRKRVMALAQRNANFYRRQRCCECGAMTSALALFSAFSLYIVFAYGFYFGQREDFTLERKIFPSKVTGEEVGIAICNGYRS